MNDKPKRGNGRGTVRKLPSGRWQWRATVELPSGELQRVAGTVATKTEAEEALSRVRTDAARGQYAVTDRTTLEEYIRAWHEVRKQGQAATYARSHESMMNTHIIPGLGKRRLSSITPRDLEAFYAALTYQDERRGKELKGVKPLSDSMKRMIHNMLHLVFAEAVRHGDLLRNPADVARPKYTREAAREVTVKAWTEEEAAKFYRVARRDRRGVVFCFMLATGLRIGEALGLRWENVEMGAEVARVHIRESLVSVNGKAHRTTPKTARSRRTIVVAGDALAILQEQPEQVKLDREAQEKRYKASDAVFTNSIGGPILPDNVYSLMRRLCEAAGVPYKGTHVLRHSFISIQGQHGRPLEVISAHVGHARASFTQDRYRTVFDKEREALTLEFSGLIKDSE
ncbi:tyrosine-type recombinase/integrase [Deinococcus navajonensis]|uniref:Tyrosine-type recombinase/integrase n=1 Tax=Deinococcus navajonensis TaxID=309884 RepID=A0ABV8XR12_9DEIO